MVLSRRCQGGWSIPGGWVAATSAKIPVSTCRSAMPYIKWRILSNSDWWNLWKFPRLLPPTHFLPSSLHLPPLFLETCLGFLGVWNFVSTKINSQTNMSILCPLCPLPFLWWPPWLKRPTGHLGTIGQRLIVSDGRGLKKGRRWTCRCLRLVAELNWVEPESNPTLYVLYIWCLIH